jgi:alpha/beta superfamily hydrolase
VAWHERGVTIPVEGEEIVLEGVWQSGSEGAAVVAAPHPELGGSLDNPVVNELAYALYKAGNASLRFNWRGVGGSQGEINGDVDAAVADVRAAVRHVRDTVSHPIIGAGYSFGAAALLRVALAHDCFRQLLLVAPPVTMIRDLSLYRLDVPVQVVVGERDPYAPHEELASLLDPLAKGELEVIADADHFFGDAGLADLYQRVYAFLR